MNALRRQGLRAQVEEAWLSELHSRESLKLQRRRRCRMIADDKHFARKSVVMCYYLVTTISNGG